MSIKAFTKSGEAILLEDNPIASPGGEGTVYRIVQNSRYWGNCVKIYHPLKRTAHKKSKIDYMIQNKPDRLVSENHLICWPTEIVQDDNGNFLGFMMPLAFSGSESLYEFTRPSISPSTKSINADKFDRNQATGIKKRLKICVNISAAVHSMHSTGHYTIVDYKPQNILITDSGAISVIDVDSFQVSVHKKLLFGAEVATPEYKPPEADRINQSTEYVPQSWDSFSLAVSFYEILFAIHPYTATPAGQYDALSTISEKIQNGLFVHGAKKQFLRVIPQLHNDFYNLPASIQQLFYKAFELGNTNPQSRPSVEEWGAVIFKELQNDASITANTIDIKSGNTKPKRISVTKHNPTLANGGGSGVNLTKPVKKDNDMVWRVLTGVLTFALIIMFGIQQSKESSLQATNSQIINLNADNAQLQNLNIEKENTIQELNEKIISFGNKYPITITDISFISVDSNNNRSEKKTNFSVYDSGYISTVITYNSNLKNGKSFDISFRYINPYGALTTLESSPYGYTLTEKVYVSGDFSENNQYTFSGINFGSASSGVYGVEIWCNGLMIGRSSFRMDY